jgi:hypothetical protein
LEKEIGKTAFEFEFSKNILGPGRPAWGRPAGPTLLGVGLGLLEYSPLCLYFWYLGAQQATKGNKRKGRKENKSSLGYDTFKVLL